MRTFGYKSMTNGVVRALFAIAVGVAMVLVKVNTFNILVQSLGILVAARGVLAFIILCFQKDDSGFVSSVMSAVLNIVLGAAMFFYPEVLINLIMYVIASVLIVLGLVQLLAMGSARRMIRVGLLSITLPLAVIVTGIFLMMRPSFLGELLGVITGLALILYGISELLSSWKMKKAIVEYDIKFPSEKPEDGSHAIKDVNYEKVDE